MDRGEATTDDVPGGDSVASGASARVKEILSAAEDHGRTVREQAERESEEIERGATEEAERIMDEARRAAQAAAQKRADELRRLQASIAARGPALLEGLEGAGLTHARLEALMKALAAAADRVLAAVEAPRGVARVTPSSGPGGSEDEEGDEGGDASGNGSPYEGQLPEGAPMARKPRTRESDVRFAAVLLAVQGRDRADVEVHLRSEYGVEDCEPILDEVFGSADAPA